MPTLQGFLMPLRRSERHLTYGQARATCLPRRIPMSRYIDGLYWKIVARMVWELARLGVRP